MSVNLSVVHILRTKSHFLETLAKLKTGITKQIHLSKEFLGNDFKFEANYSSSD